MRVELVFDQKPPSSVQWKVLYNWEVILLQRGGSAIHQ